MHSVASMPPQPYGKRKRKSDTFEGAFLKKLAPPEALLTAFPPSATRGQPPSKRLSLVLHQDERSPIVARGQPVGLSLVLHQDERRLTVARRQPVAKRAAENGSLAGQYRQVRYEAEFVRMREQMDLLTQQMAQLQADLRAPQSLQEVVREKYEETVRLNKEAADLHREVASRETEGEGGKGENERERERKEGVAGGDAPKGPGIRSSLAGAQSRQIFAQLHDLRLDDRQQKSRDMEIELQEAQLAVQKQERLRGAEQVEEEDEVTEQEEEESEEVTEEVTDEEEDESEEELEQGGFVQIPLTEEEEDLVDEILDGPPSESLVVSHKASNMDITKEQMQCLRKETWLNDEVINLYMILLKERESREDFQEEGDHPMCHFFNTFFYNKLRMDSGEYNYASVQRWTRRLKYKLVKCDKVIVPIHQGLHWALALINVRDQQLEYFDSVCNGASYPFSTKADPEMVLDDLAQYIMDESENKKTGSLDTSNWKRVYHRDLPQQLNGSDCGMFMVKFADFASRDAPTNFSQKDMWYFRRKLVVELTHLRAE